MENNWQRIKEPMISVIKQKEEQLLFLQTAKMLWLDQRMEQFGYILLVRLTVG